MAEPTTRRWAGWWVVALTVVIFVAGLVVLLRPPGGGPPAPPSATDIAPKVEVARLDEGPTGRLLREQATIFDPTPLFLPTKWNAGQRPLPTSVQHQPGQVFHSFAPKLVFAKADLHLPIPPAQVLPKSPLDLLKEPSRDPFLGFDRKDLTLKPLSQRYGVVEVHRLSDGRLELSQPIDRKIVLPEGQLEWRPVEFLVVVTVSGLLGRPVLLPQEGNTGNTDGQGVISFLRSYLAGTLHLGERLAPGTYRVTIGP